MASWIFKNNKQKNTNNDNDDADEEVVTLAKCWLRLAAVISTKIWPK